jgi:transcriptional regulator of acetoin/glycerol metabolism
VRYPARMQVFRGMSPRRLTGSEEAKLVAAAHKLEKAESDVDRLAVERDQLILELTEAGARITDIAVVLDMSRTTVYAALDRAREH